MSPMHERPGAGIGPHSLTPSGGKPSAEAVAEFRATMKAARVSRVVDYFADADPKTLPLHLQDDVKAAVGKRRPLLQSIDYPWLTDAGWIERQPVRPFKVK